jgi:DNA-binding CsgD family transcriptional regulator/tetratricopeptide (TPR) repeat protein
MDVRLVGRDREVEVLNGLMAGALDGTGAAALLVGEAGIGKSALAQEWARRAAADNIPVLIGRAVADVGAPAFWPWLRILDQAGRHNIGGLAASLLDLHAASASEANAGQSAAVTRFHAIEATTEALRAAADAAGLVVIVEDLQWAEDSSLRLMRHLCDELAGARLLVLGTVRDPDPGGRSAEPLQQLAGLSHLHTLRLGPLTTMDIAEYLKLGDHDVDRSWPPYLHRLVGGNPLFVRELARLLNRQGRLAQPARDLDLPVELRRLVAQRMAQLSADCRDLLGGCAAVGEEVDMELLRLSVGDDVDDLLAEALGAGVLVDDPSSPATLRFSHDLIRQARYGELTRAERIDWHRRIADAIAATGAGDGRAGELARHRLRAAVDADGRRAAVQACRDAGAAATRGLAFADAARWYGLALDVVGVDRSQRAELLLARAAAWYGEGQITNALDDCAEASDIAQRLNRRDLAAEAALVVRGFSGPAAPAIVALCQRARALLGGEDSARHAQVLAQHAFILADSGSVSEADRVSQRAMSMAERSNDPAAIVRALHARHEVTATPDRVGERLALGTRMRELADASGRSDTALWGLLWRIDAAFLLGSMAALDSDIFDLTVLVDGLGGPLPRWHLLRVQASRALVVGEFVEAEAHAMAAREVAGRMQDESATGMAYVFMGSLLRYTGGIAEHLAVTDAAIRAAGAAHFPIVAAFHGKTSMELGQHDAAAMYLQSLRPQMPELPRDGRWFPTVVHTGELAAGLGDLELAERCYSLVAPYAGCYLNGATACYGSLDRALGDIASACGQHDQADRHLATAVAMEERIGALPALAEAQLSHARALIARAAPGDRNRALGLAEKAVHTGRRLGMAPVAGAASALVDELAGARAGPGALTAREREITLLVVDGMANKAIAERLFLSERTVETHVRNLLAKLGLANRTQVAAWATRAGLRTASQHQH